MSVAEAANHLKLSRRAVINLIQSETLAAKKMPGKTGAYLLRPGDVESLRESREQRAGVNA